MKRVVFYAGMLILLACTSNKSPNESINSDSRLQNIQRRVNLITHPSSIKYDTTGLSKLSGFNNKCDDENDHPWDYYSVVDLNQDGQDDLIYSGPCLPYSQTSIYVTEANRLLLLYDHVGTVISMEDLVTQTKINSLREAIGCDFASELTEIIIEGSLPPVIHSIEYRVLPKKNFENLTNIKVKGILRTSPRKDDADKKDVCSETIYKGNQLLNIEEETEVIQLGHEGEWKLVLYDQNKFHSIIGWIHVNN
jgi:hypothetical protein